jgi:hypothetical protein
MTEAASFWQILRMYFNIVLDEGEKTLTKRNLRVASLLLIAAGGINIGVLVYMITSDVPYYSDQAIGNVILIVLIVTLLGWVTAYFGWKK